MPPQLFLCHGQDMIQLAPTHQGVSGRLSLEQGSEGSRTGLPASVSPPEKPVVLLKVAGHPGLSCNGCGVVVAQV